MTVELLIVASARPEDGVAKRMAGRALLWGLEQRGIRYRVHDPRTRPPTEPDPYGYDAVLCWSYVVFRSSEWMAGARRIEARARESGIPVINGVARCREPHSFYLETWRANGVPCARCQRFTDFAEIELDYPLLLRRDGVHQGRDLFLVKTPEEARRLIEERQRDEEKANLDLAVEFIEARDEHGYYNKFRSFLVGDRIIPAHAFIARDWLVNYGRLESGEIAERYSRDFLDEGEPRPAAVLAAARPTGSDVLALDYARRENGDYVFWEVNRHFLVLEDYGDAVDDGGAKTAGLRGRQEVFEELGLALAELVIERARR